mmetsp:Transcript_759/g.1120  ORF Transcript_759/g.1120 Transcript_759/m.1120 type:complete len:215 (-) Transcript_759:120-764(-)
MGSFETISTANALLVSKTPSTKAELSPPRGLLPWFETENVERFAFLFKKVPRFVSMYCDTLSVTRDLRERSAALISGRSSGLKWLYAVSLHDTFRRISLNGTGSRPASSRRLEFAMPIERIVFSRSLRSEPGSAGRSNRMTALQTPNPFSSSKPAARRLSRSSMEASAILSFSLLANRYNRAHVHSSGSSASNVTLRIARLARASLANEISFGS